MDSKPIPKDTQQHLDNIKFMMALHGNLKTYVECLPQDAGAFNIPNSNQWIREFDIKFGVKWQKVKMRKEIIDWLYTKNIGMEFIKEFEQFLKSENNLDSCQKQDEQEQLWEEILSQLHPYFLKEDYQEFKEKFKKEYSITRNPIADDNIKNNQK